MKTFVDTNVFVYRLDARDPVKQATADQWIGMLWRQRSGRTSMQVLNELYVTLTGKLKAKIKEDDAWDTVNSLLGWEPVATDRDLLTQAREIQRRYRISWWDSLIVSAAQAQDCVILLSEDLQHGMNFGAVTVRNPFETAVRVQEPLEPYRVEPPLAPRHRPRGRPRKTATA